MILRAATLVITLTLIAAGDSPTKPATSADDKMSQSKKVEVGKNIFLEKLQDGKRRVLVDGIVCLREGPLELFLCRKYTKEHEAVVCADIDARDLHKALLLAGAVAGSPVQFEPKYKPATGSVIKVRVRYDDSGKEKMVDAQSWIRVAKTGKELDKDWVFAGSSFFTPEPATEKGPPRQQLYAANGGDIICVSNFSSALLDLPFPSPDVNDELMFEAFKGRIPPLGAKVTIVFEPLPDKPVPNPMEKSKR